MESFQDQTEIKTSSSFLPKKLAEDFYYFGCGTELYFLKNKTNKETKVTYDCGYITIRPLLFFYRFSQIGQKVIFAE
jgi:hypothetical protein